MCDLAGERRLINKLYDGTESLLEDVDRELYSVKQIRLWTLSCGAPTFALALPTLLCLSLDGIGAFKGLFLVIGWGPELVSEL